MENVTSNSLLYLNVTLNTRFEESPFSNFGFPSKTAPCRGKGADGSIRKLSSLSMVLLMMGVVLPPNSVSSGCLVSVACTVWRNEDSQSKIQERRKESDHIFIKRASLTKAERGTIRMLQKITGTALWQVTHKALHNNTKPSQECIRVMLRPLFHLHEV